MDSVSPHPQLQGQEAYISTSLHNDANTKWFVAAIVVCIILGTGVFLLVQNANKNSTNNTRASRNPQENKVTTNSVTPTPIVLPCPATADFCKNAKPVYRNGQYIGFGYVLPAKTPLYSVFDGKAIRFSATEMQEKPISYSYITLKNSTNTYSAIYYVANSKLQLKDAYSKGEVLLTIGSDKLPLPQFRIYNFVFLLLDKKNQPVPRDNIVFQ